MDNSVIITGSFNWSSQAVNHNQENVLFYENKEIAQKYTDEFNNLWNNFETVINKEEAIKYIENKEEMERKNKEKLEIKIKKQKERLLKKQEKEKEKAELLNQKKMEKLEKYKTRTRRGCHSIKKQNE